MTEYYRNEIGGSGKFESINLISQLTGNSNFNTFRKVTEY